MPDIDAGYIRFYNSKFEHLVQQMPSILQSCVYQGPDKSGKTGMVVEQLGTVDPQEVTQRHQQVTLTDPPHDSRWVDPRDFYVASGVDEHDVIRRLSDPEGEYAKSQVYGMNRKKDDLILLAFFADAKTGEDGATTTTATQDNVGNVAVGTTGATLDKYRDGKRQLRAAEALAVGDPVYTAIAAQQHEDLMTETQMISLDYTSRPRLENDEITSFMGIQFKDSQRLNVNASGHQRVPLWCKSGMAFQSWIGTKTKVQDRPDMVSTMQVKTLSTFNATRLQGEKVVEIVCDIP